VPDQPVQPKVLFVSNLFPPDVVGGAELVAARQALALAKRGCRVEVFAGFRPTSPAKAGSLGTDKWRGLRIHRLGLRSLAEDDNFHWELAERYFSAVLRAGAFDVVHFHNMMGLGMGMIDIARTYGCRTVVTVHDHWGFCYRSTRLRDDDSICNNFDQCHVCKPTISFEDRLALPMRVRRDYVWLELAKADALVFPSRYLADAYATAGFDRARMAVVSNGIDIPTFRTTKVKSEQVRFLSLAYLGEHKGILVLIDALRLLAEDETLDGRWTMRIGGAGHLEDFVRREASSAKLRDKVEFLGRVPRDEVVNLYNQTDVLILPSIWPENEPVTLLEAIATGTAQIATDTGGHPELVVDGETGMLIPPGDAKGLALAMRGYILAPSVAAAQGRSNVKRRNEFDEQRCIVQLLGIYSSNSPPSSPDEECPTVICIGARPQEYIRRILENWPALASELNAVRFVSDAWWPAHSFSKASAIWFWDNAPLPKALLQALRSGRPILVPADDPRLRALRELGAPVLTYSDGLGALSLLKAVVSREGIDGWLAPAAAGADLLAESLERPAFTSLAVG
jgi:glycosyltransferase involved in cell wall biosynthesis